MKRRKRYTLKEVAKKPVKDYSWDKVSGRFGKWWMRERNIQTGIGCFRTDPRGEKRMFALIYRHQCGEVVVMTARANAMGVDAVTFAYSIMDLFDELMDAADGLKAAYTRDHGDEEQSGKAAK